MMLRFIYALAESHEGISVWSNVEHIGAYSKSHSSLGLHQL